MRTLIVALCACLLLCCRNSSQPDNTEKQEQKYTLASFKNENIDFGKVKEGKQVRMTYKFINKGAIPMIIYDVKPGCGCTDAQWPQKPIPPGKEDSVSVVFDSRHRLGVQNKYMVLFYNTKEKAKILSFSGTVKE